MKKAIMIACVFAMAFSAAGCGGNGTEHPEAQQEMQQKETGEKQEDVVDKQAVYDYLNGLLESKDNPSLREEIGFEDMDINSDEAKKIISDWREECEAYEDKCTQETADKFGLTTDEVDTIFYEMISGLY